MTNPFYKTNKWKKKRSNTFRKDQYICRECKRYGRTTPATMVHHIYPLEQYPEYKLTSINLISLCNKCHEGMHDRLTNEITAKGKVWQDKIKNKLDELKI